MYLVNVGGTNMTKKIKHEDFKLSIEILNHAITNMSGIDFMNYCLNSWRSTKDNYDSYYEEKYEKFINNPFSYFSTLEKDNLNKTLEGLIDYYMGKNIKDKGFLPSQKEGIDFIIKHYDPSLHDFEGNKEDHLFNLEQENIAVVFSDILYLKKRFDIYNNEWNYFRMREIEDMYIKNEEILLKG
tara:strand:+ start:219 stop:770 length:552 start_codon:yes stop_codon:yes gene_type:complete